MQAQRASALPGTAESTGGVSFPGLSYQHSLLRNPTEAFRRYTVVSLDASFIAAWPAKTHWVICNIATGHIPVNDKYKGTFADFLKDCYM